MPPKKKDAPADALQDGPPEEEEPGPGKVVISFGCSKVKDLPRELQTLLGFSGFCKEFRTGASAESDWEFTKDSVIRLQNQDLYNDLVERSLVISLRDASAENAVVGKAELNLSPLLHDSTEVSADLELQLSPEYYAKWWKDDEVDPKKKDKNAPPVETKDREPLFEGAAPPPTVLSVSIKVEELLGPAEDRDCWTTLTLEVEGVFSLPDPLTSLGVVSPGDFQAHPVSYRGTFLGEPGGPVERPFQTGDRSELTFGVELRMGCGASVVAEPKAFLARQFSVRVFGDRRAGLSPFGGNHFKGGLPLPCCHIDDMGKVLAQGASQESLDWTEGSINHSRSTKSTMADSPAIDGSIFASEADSFGAETSGPDLANSKLHANLRKWAQTFERECGPEDFPRLARLLIRKQVRPANARNTELEIGRTQTAEEESTGTNSLGSRRLTEPALAEVRFDAARVIGSPGPRGRSRRSEGSPAAAVPKKGRPADAGGSLAQLEQGANAMLERDMDYEAERSRGDRWRDSSSRRPQQKPGCLDDFAAPCALADAMKRSVQEATEFLRTMGGLGTPVCITLAQRSWVEESMKAFLPQLAQLWEEMGVDVHYATEEYVTSITRQGHWCTKPSGHSQLEGTVLELQQRCIKKRKVMQRVLRRFNLKNGNVWLNAVSLGDGLAERNALQEISLHHQNPPDPVTGEIPIFRVKTIQMLEEPLIHELQSQLKVLRGWLRPLVNWAQDLDTVLGD
ncbi:unnamed protein product [Effrenium voratum]|nr:unnamed protein product [Effrenium voratum]